MQTLFRPLQGGPQLPGGIRLSRALTPCHAEIDLSSPLPVVGWQYRATTLQCRGLWDSLSDQGPGDYPLKLRRAILHQHRRVIIGAEGQNPTKVQGADACVIIGEVPGSPTNGPSPPSAQRGQFPISPYRFEWRAVFFSLCASATAWGVLRPCWVMVLSSRPVGAQPFANRRQRLASSAPLHLLQGVLTQEPASRHYYCLAI